MESIRAPVSLRCSHKKGWRAFRVFCARITRPTQIDFGAPSYARHVTDKDNILRARGKRNSLFFMSCTWPIGVWLSKRCRGGTGEVVARVCLLVCINARVNETPDLLDSSRDGDIGKAEGSGATTTSAQGHTTECVEANVRTHTHTRTHLGWVNQWTKPHVVLIWLQLETNTVHPMGLG